MTVHKEYIGDGVYVDLDGCGGFILTTWDGYRDTNTIYIEPEVFAALMRWIEDMKRLKQAVEAREA